jgi:hypothetical protein
VLYNQSTGSQVEKEEFDKVQIHHVLSDITGLSLAILDTILAGERGCVKLAQLCHPSVEEVT